jgi:hypothetical protein
MHNSIIKFADNMTVVGLINNADETTYREEVRDLAVRCQDNNLSISKTEELIVDYRKGGGPQCRGSRVSSSSVSTSLRT